MARSKAKARAVEQYPAAYDLGRAAYARGALSVPAHDPALCASLKGGTGKATIARLDAWLCGFHEALHEATADLLERVIGGDHV